LGYNVGVTVKLPEPVAVPSAVVTDIPPVTAPGITIPTNCVPVFEITIAGLPPMLKAVGLLISAPVIVTKVPTGPDDGLKEVIVGVAANKVCTPRMNNTTDSKAFVFIN
jgi:hypothetical protein